MCVAASRACILCISPEQNLLREGNVFAATQARQESNGAVVLRNSVCSDRLKIIMTWGHPNILVTYRPPVAWSVKKSVVVFFLLGTKLYLERFTSSGGTNELRA